MNKRYTEAKAKINKSQLHSITEAVALVQSMPKAAFDETVEIHVRVGIDPKQGDQQVRGTIALPHGSGKKVRVAAFVDSANETAAKNAGADIVATEETIEQIVATGKIDFDVAVAVPAMMPKLAKAAKVLGPRGLMPNPKTDTVGPNIEKMITEQKGGKVSFKNDNTCNIHTIVGKVSFDATKLAENIALTLETIKKAKPNSSKGVYMKTAFLTTTMGPSIKLDLSTI